MSLPGRTSSVCSGRSPLCLEDSASPPRKVGESCVVVSRLCFEGSVSLLRKAGEKCVVVSPLCFEDSASPAQGGGEDALVVSAVASRGGRFPQARCLVSKTRRAGEGCAGEFGGTVGRVASRGPNAFSPRWKRGESRSEAEGRGVATPAGPRFPLCSRACTRRPTSSRPRLRRGSGRSGRPLLR